MKYDNRSIVVKLCHFITKTIRYMLISLLAKCYFRCHNILIINFVNKYTLYHHLSDILISIVPGKSLLFIGVRQNGIIIRFITFIINIFLLFFLQYLSYLILWLICYTKHFHGCFKRYNAVVI